MSAVRERLELITRLYADALDIVSLKMDQLDTGVVDEDRLKELLKSIRPYASGPLVSFLCSAIAELAAEFCKQNDVDRDAVLATLRQTAAHLLNNAEEHLRANGIQI